MHLEFRLPFGTSHPFRALVIKASCPPSLGTSTATKLLKGKIKKKRERKVPNRNRALGLAAHINHAACVLMFTMHPTPGAGGLGRCLVDVYITNFELIGTEVFVL